MIRTHEPPVANGCRDSFSRGLAWIFADIIFSL
jgi:hypothetical protein